MKSCDKRKFSSKPKDIMIMIIRGVNLLWTMRNLIINDNNLLWTMRNLIINDNSKVIEKRTLALHRVN